MSTTHQLVRTDVAQQTSQPSVQTRRVHVPASLTTVHTRLYGFSVMSLGDAQHGLFHRLVRERFDGVELGEFLRHVGEFGRGGVVDKVLDGRSSCREISLERV